MKVSEIDTVIIADFIRADDYDEDMLQRLYDAAVAYTESYTGLTKEQIDQHPDITTAVLVLIQDMYDNRSMYVDKNNANRTVETILGMYSTNLL